MIDKDNKTAVILPNSGFWSKELSANELSRSYKHNDLPRKVYSPRADAFKKNLDLEDNIHFPNTLESTMNKLRETAEYIDEFKKPIDKICKTEDIVIKNEKKYKHKK